MDLPKFISVHVPKTGGSSFKNSLMKIYKGKLLLDYLPSKKLDYKDAYVIHGHFNYTKYNHMETKICWIRNPLDRMISLYNHFRTHSSKNPMSYVVERKESFVGLFKYAQCAFTSFTGTDPSKYAFIGRLEHYNEDMDRFNKQFNLNLPYVKVNVGPAKGMVVPTDHEKDLIKERLKDDYDFYNEATNG